MIEKGNPGPGIMGRSIQLRCKIPSLSRSESLVLIPKVFYYSPYVTKLQISAVASMSQYRWYFIPSLQSWNTVIIDSHQGASLWGR